MAWSSSSGASLLSRAWRPLLPYEPHLAVLAALGFATSVCGGLFLLRVAISGRLTHAGLVWNLFLAWLPLAGVLGAELQSRAGRAAWRVWAAAGFWLLFFPNAPYLVTDIMHLRQRPPVPFWLDLILVACFAWTGFLLGIVSLRLMQLLVESRHGRLRGWLFALASIGLASFGIYLGRFLRFNSWDVVANPWPLLSRVGHMVLAPWEHPRTLAFSGAFGLFFLSAYLVQVSMGRVGVASRPGSSGA